MTHDELITLGLEAIAFALPWVPTMVCCRLVTLAAWLFMRGARLI